MITALEPIGAVATQAATASSPTAGATNFGTALMDGLSNLSASQATATDMVMAYAAGEKVSSHEMVIAMEKAKLSLQFAVEVRNRVVEGYQELARMQI